MKRILKYLLRNPRTKKMLKDVVRSLSPLIKEFSERGPIDLTALGAALLLFTDKFKSLQTSAPEYIKSLQTSAPESDSIPTLPVAVTPEPPKPTPPPEVRYEGPLQGLTIKSARTKKNYNLGNIRPSTSEYEGQVGVETIKGKGSYVQFSDPYYSMVAIFNNSIVRHDLDNEFWQKDLEKLWPKECKALHAQGHYIPKKGKNLYRVSFHFAPPTDNNDTWAYAQHFVQTGVWSSVDATLDITQKKQFTAFFKTVLLWEQGTRVEDWYLDAVYESLFNQAPPPLQSTLAKTSVTKNTETHISIGSRNKSKNP